MSPYKNPEKKKEHDRKYYCKNRERIKKRAREKYWREKEKIQGRRRELNTAEKRARASKKECLRYAASRAVVVKAYGSRCACCGEDEPLFLEIDHINNDGGSHRKQIGRSGASIVHWLIRNNFPDEFQLLCSNCNQGKKRNKGVCPHKEG